MTFSIDVPTLAIITVAVAAILGGLMLFSWNQNRAMPALAWWGTAYLVGSIGIGLISFRSVIPNVLSIEAANATVLLSYGLCWFGARVFDARPVRIAAILIAPAVWIVACQLPFFAGDINARVVLYSCLGAPLLVLTAYEIWRGREEPLASRWPATVVLYVYGALMTLRGALVIIVPIPNTDGPITANGWFAIVAVSALFFTIVFAFLLLTLTKERTELKYKSASLVDPLTGIANRRAFLDRAARHVARQMHSREPIAVLLFDLDRFKKINDDFGHAVGDRVLQIFADTVSRTIRPGDLVGRLGGEEFAAVLPGAHLPDAADVAERIRHAFADAASVVTNCRVAATVSIGVTATREPGGDVDGFMVVADRALYRAKALGRNRVEAIDLDSMPGSFAAAPPIAPDAAEENDLVNGLAIP